MQHKRKCTSRVTSKFLPVAGEHIYTSAAARSLGLPVSTLFSRIDRGWSFERAVMTPARFKSPDRNHQPEHRA